eukprot:351204-Chlamydomonas_euryale.AAC.5
MRTCSRALAFDAPSYTLRRTATEASACALSARTPPPVSVRAPGEASARSWPAGQAGGPRDLA